MKSATESKQQEHDEDGFGSGSAILPARLQNGGPTKISELFA
jgi:hypothetical protein